jgi:hypothetical protein
MVSRGSSVARWMTALGRLTGVIIEGEAGIGKSRLMSEGLVAARDRGFQIAAGRAEELESTRPFGLLVDAFDCSPSSSDPRRAAIAGLLTTQVGERGSDMSVVLPRRSVTPWWAFSSTFDLAVWGDFENDDGNIVARLVGLELNYFVHDVTGDARCVIVEFPHQKRL